MIIAAKLAGFFAAHAVTSLAEGDGFVPMFAYTAEDGTRKMERLVVDNDLETSVHHGRKKLQSNDVDANDAVLVYDGRVQIDDEKLDAIIVEMRVYFSPQSEAIIAVPYTPSGDGELRIHTVKVLSWKECDDFDIQHVLSEFFDGVHEHESGAKIWDACLDESK